MHAGWRRAAVGTFALLGAALAAELAFAQGPETKVVATIRPMHSLVAAVMQGVGTPRLLVEGLASPHTFVLKPSDARALSEADVLLRVSEGLEPFTVKLVQALPKRIRVVTLEAAPGLTLHKLRTGSMFEPHEHGQRTAYGHGHGSRHESAKGSAGNDGHIWLDPANAKALADNMAEVLGAAYPAHADRFKANAAALAARIDALEAEIAGMLKPLAGKRYIVFHDAYQYLERRYGLAPAGSVTFSPDVPASARRVAALRRKITDLKAVCVFAEPQFAPKLIDPIIEGTSVRRGTLDPLGAAIPAGPDHYFALMRALAGDLLACLAGPA
jgi:zinc transport system substrate-binding protein